MTVAAESPNVVVERRIRAEPQSAPAAIVAVSASKASIAVTLFSDADQTLVYATATAPAEDVFARPYPGPAWKTRPCWNVVGSNDRTVNPELERFVAERMDAETTELESSHVPMLSLPTAVISVIEHRSATNEGGPLLPIGAAYAGKSVVGQAVTLPIIGVATAVGIVAAAPVLVRSNLVEPKGPTFPNGDGS